MAEITRRVFHGLSIGGLVYGVAYTALGGARARREHLRRQAAARAARARVADARTHIRPLDPAIHEQRLAGEMKRRVLGLYNSLDPDTILEENHVHLKAELILNHLGLLVDLHDVNDPLPDERRMSRYRGVIAWFAGQKMKRPLEYLEWLAHQARSGRKVVVLDGLGVGEDVAGRKVPLAAMNKALAALGIAYEGKFVDDPHRIQVVSKDADMVEFERKLPTRLEFFEQYRLLDPAAKAYLTLKRTDMEQSESAMVAVTPQGAFVAPGYAINEDRFGTNFVMQWRINPFRLFAEAFGVAETPRPDFTTLGSSRVYYSHIDGDGLPSITEVNRRTMCADFTRTEVLERYDLPVTASFVVAGIEPAPRGLGDRYRVEVARRVARLPNVEVGVHGFAHPMDWRAREHAICSYEVPGYKMSAEKEIAYASDYINREINPPGKPTMVMLWTGWCNPAEDQLAIADRLGIYNLNGGDPMMDGQFPSYLHLAPVIHRIGKQTQYFTSGPNDYILTEEWLEPYHRWANIIQMAESTGAPRRVYPINVYYHFYVVEKPAALFAMHEIMKWVLRQETAPLWVSQYVDIVRDFEDMRVARIDKRSWRVLNSGYCRTVRFDRDDLHVDLGRSKGVIGYRHLTAQRALYVHLDESHDHTIVLSPQPYRGGPFVSRHTHYLEGLTLSRERVNLTMRGIGRKYLTLANMAPNSTFRVTAVVKRDLPGGSGAQSRLSWVARSDARGTLDWRGDVNGDEIELAMSRQGAGE